MAAFTEKQLSDWAKYEKVRLAGWFNMLSVEAQRSSGLTPEDYEFVMENYGELWKAAVRNQE